MKNLRDSKKFLMTITLGIVSGISTFAGQESGGNFTITNAVRLLQEAKVGLIKKLGKLPDKDYEMYSTNRERLIDIVASASIDTSINPPLREAPDGSLQQVMIDYQTATETSPERILFLRPWVVAQSQSGESTRGAQIPEVEKQLLHEAAHLVQVNKDLTAEEFANQFTDYFLRAIYPNGVPKVVVETSTNTENLSEAILMPYLLRVNVIERHRRELFDPELQKNKWAELPTVITVSNYWKKILTVSDAEAKMGSPIATATVWRSVFEQAVREAKYVVFNLDALENKNWNAVFSVSKRGPSEQQLSEYKQKIKDNQWARSHLNPINAPKVWRPTRTDGNTGK